MKYPDRSRSGLKFLCAAAALAAASIAIGAPASTPAQKPAAQVPISQIAIPQAVFVMPNNPGEGKDPFYPKSAYPYGHPQIVPQTSTVPQIVHAELKLQGFSGPPEKPLAIINGKTLGLGEEGEVNTPSGKIPVRVLQFKLDAVIVQTPSERRELKLRAGI